MSSSSPTGAERGTRGRILDAAMDLFGRQGYHATTVAEIEQAAGLRPGAGGLYRHFDSKRSLLEAGLRRQFAGGRELLDLLDPQELRSGSPVDRLVAVARAGLRRLQEERDLNRLLLRDLAAFPELLDEVRDRELRRVHKAVSGWLGSQYGDSSAEEIGALAAVLMGAVSHYWIMADVFDGRHPLDVDEETYLTALASLAAGRLGSSPSGGAAEPA
jgi:AcrR family transcriptional regulator